MKATRATLLALSLAWATGPARAAGSPGFPEIDALFLSGDFETTAKRVNDVLVRDHELAPDQRAGLYLIKARLELAFGRVGEIKLWLGKAYRDMPTMALDPVKDPPQLVGAWDEVRTASAATPVAAAAEEDPDAASGRAMRRSLAYFPFGVAQANNQQPGKALGIAGLHLSLVTLAALAPERPERNAALGLFVVAWTYSILDGVENRKDGTKVAAIVTPERGVGLLLSAAL